MRSAADCALGCLLLIPVHCLHSIRPQCSRHAVHVSPALQHRHPPAAGMHSKELTHVCMSGCVLRPVAHVGRLAKVGNYAPQPEDDCCPGICCGRCRALHQMLVPLQFWKSQPWHADGRPASLCKLCRQTEMCNPQQGPAQSPDGMTGGDRQAGCDMGPQTSPQC